MEIKEGKKRSRSAPFSHVSNQMDSGKFFCG